jgi:acyl-CoA synthetase (AMP-forming)/AMP-acid ligase II
MEVPVGEEGELIANGPQVMKGYLNKPEETANALRDFQGEKWLYTGDVAKMDVDGFFSIADRVKDMLIVGGFKVFSREVEEKLYQLPDVEFCAVVGVPNAERPGNDIVKLVVQVSAPAAEKDPQVLKEEIAAFCKKKMAPYKIPKIIEFTDAIPLTAVGKVDKKVLR